MIKIIIFIIFFSEGLFSHSFQDKIVPLEGGKTNQSFLVQHQGKRMVLRLGTPSPEILGIDRQMEAFFLEKAAEKSIGPQLYFVFPKEGILLSEFLEGNSLIPQQLSDQTTLEEIIQLMKIFLQQDTEIVKKYHQKSKIIWENIIRDTPIKENSKAWQEAMRLVSLCLYENVGLCHGDMWAPNIIRLTNGTYRLIDWEYGFVGNILYDLAFLSVINKIDPNRVLTTYFGDDAPSYKEGFEEMVTLIHLRCVLWVYKKWFLFGEQTIEYYHYFQKHFEKLPLTFKLPLNQKISLSFLVDSKKS